MSQRIYTIASSISIQRTAYSIEVHTYYIHAHKHTYLFLELLTVQEFVRLPPKPGDAVAAPPSSLPANPTA